MIERLPLFSSSNISASSEPNASPSGRTCAVLANSSQDRMISRARSSILSVVFRFDFAQQLFDSKTLLDRFVVFEDELRNSLQMMQAFAERVADIAGRGSPAVHGPFVIFRGSDRKSTRLNS